jgi:predicted TIM-barrel enzyme
MASVVLPGTPGGMGAASGFLGVGSRGGSLVDADPATRLPGRAAVMADSIGTSSMVQLPTEVAITESMRRFTRIAHAANAS